MKQHEGSPSGPPQTSARKALAQALRTMHQHSGKTLRSLERDISISDSTLSRYLRGQAVPTWPTVEKICAALGRDPEPLRGLWTKAMEEKSQEAAEPQEGQAPPASAAPPPPAQRPGRGPVRSLVRLRAPGGGAVRVMWGAVGMVLGLLAGYPLGAEFTEHAAVATASGTEVRRIPPHLLPAATGTLCPWKYVVTDGNPDNVLVFDDTHRDSIVAQYVPRQVFYAPYPPQVRNGLMRTEQGWVGVGDWIRRYRRASCRTGGM